jgi:hypothetical protein
MLMLFRICLRNHLTKRGPKRDVLLEHKNDRKDFEKRLTDVNRPSFVELSQVTDCMNADRLESAQVREHELSDCLIA